MTTHSCAFCKGTGRSGATAHGGWCKTCRGTGRVVPPSLLPKRRRAKDRYSFDAYLLQWQSRTGGKV